MAVKRKKRYRDTRSAIQKACADQVRTAGDILYQQMRGAAGSVGPKIVTGKLRRSIKINKRGLRNKTRPAVYVGPRIWYAPVQEYGGVLTAKKKYLTIPLNKRAEKIADKGSIRSLKLITVRSKAGNLIMGHKTEKRKDFRPMFVLKKSVRIPARPLVRPVLRRVMPMLHQILSREAIMARAKSYEGSGA
jgi:hypothetical protein